MAKALFLIFINLTVIVGGGYVMNKLVERSCKTADVTPLGMRWQSGYTKETAIEYWKTLSEREPDLSTERKFLLIDLVFPFIYGGAFFATLLYATTSNHHPVPPALLLLLIAAIALADWIENLIQLQQIKLFAQNEADVNVLQIHIASIATRIKWLLSATVFILVIYFSIDWNDSK